MRIAKLLVSVLALSAAHTAMASAADMDIIPAPVEDAYVPVEVGSGWYIRGDISYDLKSSTGGSYRTYGDVDPDPLVTAYGYGTSAYDNFDFEADRDLSIGVGYQFNSYLRGDVTGGYWKRGVRGIDSDPVPCGDPATFPTAVSCRSTDSTSVTAWEVMANGYADLGTYVGLTPYVGAGLGMTNLKFDGLSNTSDCLDASGNVVPGCGYTASHGGADSWRLTWALMAGVSYDMTKNLKLDLGYRYSRIEGGDMFNFDAPTAALGATGVQGSHGALSTHQLKAGVRYSIW